MSNNLYNEKLDFSKTIKATVQGAAYPKLMEEKISKEGNKYKSFVEDSNGNFIEDTSKVQIQTFILDKNNKEVKKTFTLHKELTIEELEKMIDKTFIFTGIEEYSHKNDSGFTSYTYSAKDFKPNSIETDKVIFEIDNSLIAMVSNVVEVESKDKAGETTISTVFQLRIKQGIRRDVKDIKLKNASAGMFKNLIGKRVKFKGVKSFKMGTNTYYTISEAPKEIK